MNQTWQQAKHQCIISILLMLNPNHNTIQSTRKKCNSIPAKTRTLPLKEKQSEKNVLICLLKWYIVGAKFLKELLCLCGTNTQRWAVRCTDRVCKCLQKSGWSQLRCSHGGINADYKHQCYTSGTFRSLAMVLVGSGVRLWKKQELSCVDLSWRPYMALGPPGDLPE